jgi:hypothetical protein
MVAGGLYTIKDRYFQDFPHEKHTLNKGGRPFFYAVHDCESIFWLVPLSRQVSTYKRKIEAVEARRGIGRCMAYHIGAFMGEERVFRICNMIPVTADYVGGEFTIEGKPYLIEDKLLLTVLNRKARDYLKQLELGRMYSQVDALDIRRKLIEGS